jgi:hypothetical protein
MIEPQQQFTKDLDMSRRLFLAFAAAVGMSLWGTAAHATLLSPGDSSATVDTGVVAGSGFLATNTGTVSNGNASGELLTAVYTDSVTGNLDFAYQVVNKGPDDLKRLTMIDFTQAGTFAAIKPNSVNVFADAAPAGTFWQTPAAGLVAPTQTDRFSADTVGFDFTTGAGGTGNPNIGVGQASDVVVIQTAVKQFRPGLFEVIDGGVLQITAFEPTAVPEPSTLGLVGLGALGFIGYASRRRKASAA